MSTLVLAEVADGACSLERLRIHRFRNYAEQSVEFGRAINVVGGRNAQGKTNLLEAVATLLLTRSPRASSDRANTRLRRPLWQPRGIAA